MSNLELALIILGMFIVTYGIRVVLFAGAHRAEIPEWLDKALKFVPISVLTAIIAPMSLTNSEGLALSLLNPWFVGALTSLLIGLVFKRQLLTICVGVLVFFLMKLFVGG
ncbi:AzlD domain-containing protein [Maribrevibacterium harenarium]|uniref:AzlD domain-containing protein n=1 Tax=Maribrevibacterium harenarium TaxID=2589817 RepID=A0A501X5A0_9GAMM|nr:AzlD domain-containing protein [Maribrevibacterium harenarium]TPE55686.1 AzlD domain-containing protein [Maribrevibacterium harenarium]